MKMAESAREKRRRKKEAAHESADTKKETH